MLSKVVLYRRREQLVEVRFKLVTASEALKVTLEAKFSKHAFVEFGAAEAGAGGTDVDLLSD